MACGVSLALRARLFRERDIRHVYTPPQAIAGRAGGVRARRNGLYDWSIFSLYLPATVRLVEHREAVKAVWRWMSRTLSELPARTTPIILLDANAHVGSRRLLEEGDQEGVGPFGREVQSWSGGQMR
eukprot:11344808-Heterocapsa_arctica.AAC.1